MGDKTDDYEYTEEEIAFLSEAHLAEELENRRVRALFLSVFNTEHGKQVLNALKTDVCCIGKSCFNENPVVMARMAGRQEVALAIDEILSTAVREAEEKSDGD